MDTGQGEFKALEIPDLPPSKSLDDAVGEIKQKMENAYPNHGGWFRVGEKVELNGSRFRVKAVKPTELRLKLLKK